MGLGIFDHFGSYYHGKPITYTLWDPSVHLILNGNEFYGLLEDRQSRVDRDFECRLWDLRGAKR